MLGFLKSADVGRYREKKPEVSEKDIYNIGNMT